MLAAEGEVQEKGYVASFPSLINVSGQATYIMVLKDTGGLVKLYALVNVEKYSVVATGTTQTDAKQEYIKLLKQNGILNDSVPTPDQTTPKAEVKVVKTRIVTVDDDSLLYITADDGCVYKKSIMADESVMLINEGDEIEIAYSESNVEKIRNIMSWSYKIATEESE